MSLEAIHLWKLLKLLYLEPNQQVSEMRSDIRMDIARERGAAGDGGDFHGPFWKDARDHVFNIRDLRESVRERIASNASRARLYPRLRDGFLQWWDQRRRWTNEPFHPVRSPHARFRLGDLGTIKIENILAVRDAAGTDHFVYPYFSEKPPLSEEGARIGLWLLAAAIPAGNPEDMRILDVIRGQTFSLDRYPLTGDEEAIVRRRYASLLAQWRALRDEYS